MKFKFPLLGIDKSGSQSEQSNLTTSSMNNVRPIDALEKRTRGGQRPGLDKWGAGTQIGNIDAPVVAMCVVASVE